VLNFVVRRIAYSIPVILVASVLVFLFVHETTDPLARLRQNKDPTAITRERVRLGLDKPVTTQYLRWLKDFSRGKMGNSFVSGRSVSSELKDKLWNTIQLIIWGVLLSATVAIAIGVYSAVRQYSVLDYTFTGLSFVGLSMPPFWFGLIAIQLLSFQLRETFHLKQPLFFSIGIHSHTGAGFADYLRHLALPVLTLTVQIIAEWSRYQRSSMLDVMSSDYIRTARAKGLRRSKVIFKHALRNALIPLITVMGIEIGLLFGGLVVTEQIFSWPGMGKLFIDALTNGDTNVLLPWLMVTATFVIAFNLLADVVYGTLDPRIRLA
jgi:peptide/nickel transport system permease protein